MSATKMSKALIPTDVITSNCAIRGANIIVLERGEIVTKVVRID